MFSIQYWYWNFQYITDTNSNTDIDPCLIKYVQSSNFWKLRDINFSHFTRNLTKSYTKVHDFPEKVLVSGIDIIKIKFYWYNTQKWYRPSQGLCICDTQPLITVRRVYDEDSKWEECIWVVHTINIGTYSQSKYRVCMTDVLLWKLSTVLTGYFNTSILACINIIFITSVNGLTTHISYTTWGL